MARKRFGGGIGDDPLGLLRKKKVRAASGAAELGVEREGNLSPEEVAFRGRAGRDAGPASIPDGGGLDLPRAEAGGLRTEPLPVEDKGLTIDEARTRRFGPLGEGSNAADFPDIGEEALLGVDREAVGAQRTTIAGPLGTAERTTVAAPGQDQLARVDRVEGPLGGEAARVQRVEPAAPGKLPESPFEKASRERRENLNLTRSIRWPSGTATSVRNKRAQALIDRLAEARKNDGIIEGRRAAKLGVEQRGREDKLGAEERERKFRASESALGREAAATEGAAERAAEAAQAQAGAAAKVVESDADRAAAAEAAGRPKPYVTSKGIAVFDPKTEGVKFVQPDEADKEAETYDNMDPVKLSELALKFDKGDPTVKGLDGVSRGAYDLAQLKGDTATMKAILEGQGTQSEESKAIFDSIYGAMGRRGLVAKKRGGGGGAYVPGSL